MAAVETDLVVDEVVEGDGAADQRAQVHTQHLVVGLPAQRRHKIVVSNVWQQIENLLCARMRIDGKGNKIGQSEEQTKRKRKGEPKATNVHRASK